MGISSSTSAIDAGGKTLSLFGDFNYKLFIYIIIAIVIEIAAIAYAMRSEKYIMLAIFVPLSLYVFLVYGMRWFSTGGLYGTGASVPWPPAINSCPDFLTAYNMTSSGSGSTKLTGCIDTIGISSNGGFTLSTGSSTSAATYRGTATPATALSLSSGRSDFFPTNVPGESTSALCKRLENAGLTWDGVWDGENCMSKNGSRISGKGVTSSGNCTY